MATTKTHSRIAHFPFYYGWVVWAAATVGIIATLPVSGASVSLFLDDFIRDFGISRSAVSGLFSGATLLASVNLAWYGRQVDRYGYRVSTVIIGALYALALAAFASVQGAVTLFMGFVVLRNLGQGALFLTTSSVIAEWFERSRGRVVALSMIAAALAQALYMPNLAHFLERNDWHEAWLLMGIVMGVGILPLLGLLLRDSPQAYGLEYDRPVTTLVIGDDMTLRQAQHTLVFWIFVLGRLVAPIFVSGLIFHQISIFQSLGYSATTAAAAFGKSALLGVAFSLLFGYLLDRVHPGWVLSLHLAGVLFTLVALLNMRDHWILSIYILTFSIVNGGGAVFDGAAWTNLFGRRHQGAIRGFVRMIIIVGTAVGPLLFGVSYDLLGSYTPVMTTGVIVIGVALLLSFKVSYPQRMS